MITINQKDYYDILGGERNTSQQAIKEAYRKLALLVSETDPDCTKVRNVGSHPVMLLTVS